MTSGRRDEAPDDNELPSYDDVVREDANRVQQNVYTPPAPPTPRRGRNEARPAPPPPNPRPHSHSHSHSHSYSQSNSQNAPGPRRSGKPMPQATSAPPSPWPVSQQSTLPWRYPSGYYCSKCANTGYKSKNGRSCKSCWRRFAPVNNVNALPGTGVSTYLNPFFTGMSRSAYPLGQPPQTMSGQLPPLVVKPGDPRLGGVLCGECRGTGRVTFLLDEDLCPLCRGVGRIIR